MDSAAWQVVLLAAIGAVVTLASPVIAFLLARVVSQQSQIKDATNQIHTIVNSQDTEQKKRLAEMNKQLVDMTVVNTELREAARALALSVARAEQPLRTTPLPVEIVPTEAPLPVEVVNDEGKPK